MKSRRTFAFWLVANSVGMGIYLWLASALWVKPEEQGMPGGPGDAFYWAFALAPIIGGFFIANIFVLIKLVIEFRSNKELVPILLWIIVISVWLNVLLLDHMKAVRYIDSKYAQQNPAVDSFTTA